MRNVALLQEMAFVFPKLDERKVSRLTFVGSSDIKGVIDRARKNGGVGVIKMQMLGEKV